MAAMTIGPDDDLTVPEDPESPGADLDPVTEADPADVADQHSAVPYDEDEDADPEQAEET